MLCQVTALQEELGEALHLQQVARTEAEAVTNQLAEDLERERGRMEGMLLYVLVFIHVC